MRTSFAAFTIIALALAAEPRAQESWSLDLEEALSIGHGNEGDIMVVVGSGPAHEWVRGSRMHPKGIFGGEVQAFGERFELVDLTAPGLDQSGDYETFDRAEIADFLAAQDGDGEHAVVLMTRRGTVYARVAPRPGDDGSWVTALEEQFRRRGRYLSNLRVIMGGEQSAGGELLGALETFATGDAEGAALELLGPQETVEQSAAKAAKIATGQVQRMAAAYLEAAADDHDRPGPRRVRESTRPEKESAIMAPASEASADVASLL